MDYRSQLTSICELKLKELGLIDPSYQIRLKDEISELSGKDKCQYMLEQEHVFRNENNLLVPYLLGICEEYDHQLPPAYEYGELPDIDIDYFPKVKKYVKEDYCPKTFGEDKVCNISTYSRFGIRSALIDMARVLELDQYEVMSLTTSLNVKDDEGETLTWDKAIELYDDLKNYLEKHPELAQAAKRLINRIRGLGVHASGLIISGVPLAEFVPLVKPPKAGSVASAWVEGLGGTDLGAVGLIKFDFLGLDAIQKIAEAKHIAEVDKVCDLPGKESWSDESYLEDPEVLAMAEKDLRMVFQFDGSPDIRRLAKEGGVTCFNDLVAYTSLFRPSCIKVGMHKSYCQRKRGLEKYEIHPKLQDTLGYTYGVCVFQEQVMQILNVVGKIPLKDCEAVRKAISKKKLEKFITYKEAFIKNGQEVLGESEEFLNNLWNEVEAFSGYGFNRSHGVAYSMISMRNLWEKKKLAIGFFPSFLNNTHLSGTDDYKRLKEYLQVAKRHNCECKPVCINNSKTNFTKTMYYAFSKIKGIGNEVAAKIEKLQPYKDYKDFLHRFGTNLTVNASLISLGAFGEDPLELFKYYEQYKEWLKKVKISDKKFDDYEKEFNLSITDVTNIKQFFPLTRETLESLENLSENEKLQAICKRFMRIVNNRKEKIFNFDPSLEIKDQEMIPLLTDRNKAEEEYLGFKWIHPIEEVCQGNLTFEDFDLSESQVGPVQVLVNNVEEKKSKKETKYYSVEVEDATQRKKWITVWNLDYDRFKTQLTKDNVVIMRIQKPNFPYKTFTLASTPNRYRLPAKHLDHRVIVIPR